MATQEEDKHDLEGVIAIFEPVVVDSEGRRHTW